TWAGSYSFGPIRDKDGVIVGSVVVGRDITGQKQAEHEKERLLAAINQAAETVVITDPEGTIEYVNPVFEQITGYTREEAVGQNPRVLKSDVHDTAFYAAMWKTLSAGDIWRGRLVNRKKGGSLYTEEATISPVKDAAGKIVNYVAVKRDVTEELILEDQLRQSQKMQSIGQLVGGVAHDFNNLLQIITGYTQIAQAKLDPNHAAVASLKEVSKAGDRAKDLIGQLMAFSRRQVIDPVDIDLNKEIESMLKMLGMLIGAHIRIQFIAGKGVRPVFADKGQFHQVMMNLCVNAHDAMPAGGTLTIETQEVSIALEELDACGLTRPGRYVYLSITDTGCGMDKKICEKIFEPFFTTKEVGKGTGLGLSTVYGIVKQNDGHIAVDSELGKGTVFKIYLPVSRPLPAGVINSISKNAVSSEGGAETILLADDEEALLNLEAHVLSGAGYTVLTAKDGKEAVRVFEEHADEIDLVIMDVVMPLKGGKEAMDEILKKHPAMRYFFVSGYSPNAGHAGFVKEKGLHFLSKPYQNKALLQKIRDVLEAE
ncbi:MAG: PAS domain S-box protein, partial [Kiritimatiellales bacterium]